MCLSLCLGLWSASFSSASELTPEQVQQSVYEGVFDALTAAPISFNQGAVNTVPWLYPSFNGQTLGEWLLYNFGNSTDADETFRVLLQNLLTDTESIDSRLSSGLLSGAQREQLMSWLSDIQMWGEVSATANGYRTYTQDNNLLAWSVSDEDAVSRLTTANGKLDEILAAIQSPGNWEGLEQIISGGIYDAGQNAKDGADIPDQQRLARNALSEVQANEHSGQTEGERAENDASSALDALINNEHSALPFLDNIPDLNQIDDAPTRTISKPAPDEMPSYTEEWVLVQEGFRLFDEETQGSIPFPKIALTRSATVTDSSRPYIQLAGRITAAIWGLAFGVWILHVARSDWAFYTSGGGSDATILAEQMEARRCLDINAALFGDSSLL